MFNRMRPHWLLTILFLFSTLYGFTQTNIKDTYKKEFSITTDNDSYLLRGDDGYYTDGLFLDYSWAGSRNIKGKKIHNIEIGQLMYNAQNGDYTKLSRIDRPVTALLYAGYKQSFFNNNESVLQWSVTGGAMGPPALGRQTQEFIHKLINAYTPTEWQFQLHTSVGANADIVWAPNIFHNNWNGHFAITPLVNANAGSFFTDASTGFLLQLGTFEKNSQSTMWNAHVSQGNEKFLHRKELFFYFSPTIGYRVYNATVQGGLFSRHEDDAEGFSRTLVPFFYRQKIGLFYTRNRMDLGFSVIFDTREAQEQRTCHWYGSIKLGYLFGK